MPLTDVFCRNAKPAEKPQKISDGGGLFLLIEPRGSKLWRLAYRFHGKQKTLSLGIYPAVSLKEARDLSRKNMAMYAAPEGMPVAIGV